MDNRPLLLLLEKQLIAARCSVETALSLLQGMLDEPKPAEPSATPVSDDAPHVFGGKRAGEPRLPMPGANGILGG